MDETAGSVGDTGITLAEAYAASVDWLKTNWLRTLIVSILSFIVAWGWNMWLMAYRLQERAAFGM